MWKSSCRLSLFVLATVATFSLAAAAAAAGPVMVTNGNDDGEGSLRAALQELAKQDAPGRILVVTNKAIKIDSTLTYDGKAPLAIYGKGQTVMTDTDTTLLTLSQGADLTVSGLNFRGRGNFDIKHRGGGKGIFVDVPKDRTGVVTLTLENLKVSGVAYHGIHVSDCDLNDDCGGGSGGKGDGSPASIAVRLTNVEVVEVGTGRSDADGLRVDERAAGNIFFDARNSKFTKVGADGVELDEGQEGSVIMTVADSRFDNNGAYCDPKVLKAFFPATREARFEDGKVTENEIPGKVTGSPDDACFERKVERYDSGSVKKFKFSIDFDDGFDVDEAGEGDVFALIIGSSIRGNHDEGLDLNEQDEGGITIAVWRTTAVDNTDDAFKIVESGAGSVNGLLHEVILKDNGGKGAVFEQNNKGGIDILVEQTKTANNNDGKKAGLVVIQKGDGNALLRVRNSDIADGIDAQRVKVFEK